MECMFALKSVVQGIYEEYLTTAKGCDFGRELFTEIKY